MGLGQHLGGGVHGHLHLHGVGELIGHKGGGEGDFLRSAILRHGSALRHHHQEATALHAAGGDSDRNLLHGISVAQLQAARDGFIGNAGNAQGGLVAVSRVEELRLNQGHLHRQRHHHLFLHQGVPHVLAVGVNRYIISGKLVGGADAELQGSVFGGPEVRLEGKGAGKVGAHHRGRAVRFRGYSVDQGVGGTFGHHGRRGGHGNGLFHHHTVVHHPAQPVFVHDMGYGLAAALSGDVTGSGADAHIRHGIVQHVHHRPVVGGNGVQALVPGGGQGLYARGGLQGENVFRMRVGVGSEPAEFQRQEQLGAFPAVLPLEAHGLSVHEVENLQAHGVRVGIGIVESHLSGDALGKDMAAGGEFLLVLAEEGCHHISGAVGGAQAHGDLPVAHGGGAAHEHPLHQRSQFAVGGPGKQQQAAFLVLQHVVTVMGLGLGRCPQPVQPGRQVGKVDFHQRSGVGLALALHTVPAVQQGILEGQRNPVAFLVVHAQAHHQLVFLDQILPGRPAVGIAETPPKWLILIGGKLEAAVGRVPHDHAHPDPVADEVMVVEGAHFPSGVGHDGFGPIIAGLPGLEGEGEGVVGLHGFLLVQHQRVVPHHFQVHAGACEAMAGIAFQLAAHGNLVAHQEKLFAGVEAEVEAGQHELIYTETGGAPQGTAFFPHAQGELAVPLALGQDKLSGDGAEFIGYQIFPSYLFVLRVPEYRFQFHFLPYREGFLGVTFIDDGLEAQRVAGVVSAAVPVDIAVDAGVVAAVIGVIAQAYFGGSAFSAFGHQVVKGFGLEGDFLGDGLGKRGESVQLHAAAGELPAVFEEFERRFLQRLAALMVCHVHLPALGSVPNGDGQGVLVVGGPGVDLFPAAHLYLIMAVGQDRHGDAGRIAHEEAVSGVRERPAFHPPGLLFPPVKQLHLGAIQVLEHHRDFVFVHAHIQALLREAFAEGFYIHDAAHNPLVVAGEGGTLLLKRLAVFV